MAQGRMVCGYPFSEEDENRFWSKVNRRGEDECWEWKASKINRNYGVFYLGKGKRQARAHRVAYELVKGPVPNGLFVLHGCDNPPCCNPNHLRAGTASDNRQDYLERCHQYVDKKYPATIYIRVTSKQKEIFLKAAEKAGLNVSDWARSIALLEAAKWRKP